MKSLAMKGPFAAFVLAILAAVIVPVEAALPYNFGNPSPDEELMRQLINRARIDPEAEADRFGLDNTHPDDIPDGTYDVGEGITNSGVSDQRTYWSRYQGFRQPLAWNAALNTAAINHSDDMYQFSFFSHQTQASNHGYQPGYYGSDRAYSEGYPNHFVFENIAVNTGLGYFSVEDVHRALFVDSSITQRGHRKNILHSFLREVGIGYLSYTTPNDDGWRDFWTIDFSSDAFIAAGHSGEDSNPDTVYLTGVVFDDFNDDGAYQKGEEMPGIDVYAFEVGAGQLPYYAITAEGGGYSIPLVDKDYNNIPAGQTIRVIFYDPEEKTYVSYNRTVQAGEVVFEDTEAETPTTFYQRFNIGLNAYGDDFIPAVDGDANFDDIVNLSDLGILAGNYGTLQGATRVDADFNNDGAVGISDLAILAANYNTGGEVPEPATIILLLTGIASIFSLHRNNKKNNFHRIR